MHLEGEPGRQRNDPLRLVDAGGGASDDACASGGVTWGAEEREGEHYSTHGSVSSNDPEGAVGIITRHFSRLHIYPEVKVLCFLRRKATADIVKLQLSASTTRRQNVGKISEKSCSFSAASAPIFATKYAFFNIFYQQDYLAENFEI